MSKTKAQLEKEVEALRAFITAIGEGMPPLPADPQKMNLYGLECAARLSTATIYAAGVAACLEPHLPGYAQGEAQMLRKRWAAPLHYEAERPDPRGCTCGHPGTDHIYTAPSPCAVCGCSEFSAVVTPDAEDEAAAAIVAKAVKDGTPVIVEDDGRGRTPAPGPDEGSTIAWSDEATPDDGVTAECDDYDPNFKLHGCELDAGHDGPHRNLVGYEWEEHRCPVKAGDQWCSRAEGHDGEHCDRATGRAMPDEAAPEVPPMCDAALPLGHGGELKCVLSDGHFGGHSALGGKRRWLGTGADAREEDGTHAAPEGSRA